MSKMPKEAVMDDHYAQVLFEEQAQMRKALLLINTTVSIAADGLGEGGDAAFLMMQGLEDFMELGIAQYAGGPLDPEKLRRALSMATEEGGRILLGLVFALGECYSGNTPRAVTQEERGSIGTLCILYSLWAQKHLQAGEDALSDIRI